jgi:hypothetical protein
MLSHRDQWDEKSEECVRAIEATSDPATRELLTHLKSLWMNLSNQKPILTDADMAIEISLTAGVHAEIMQIGGREVPHQHTETVPAPRGDGVVMVLADRSRRPRA